jgi:alanyl-tRNA synthetase
VPPRTASELRSAWNDFFAARDHVSIPSASLIPHDPSLLFTVAGMVPFKPYFVGDEVPPARRVVSIQKCVRAGGKHNDLDDIGRTNRHFSFFEMLGNFSFGDYFKAEAIPWAWEFVTGVLGLDPARLWVTVHVSDDEAEAIWRDRVGVPAARIQQEVAPPWATPTGSSRSGTSSSCSSTSSPRARSHCPSRASTRAPASSGC